MGAAHKQIAFENADGEQVTEDWWFQLDETDAIEMEIIHELLQGGDPEGTLRSIIKNQDSKALLRLWKELLLASVCKRDGNLLRKDKDVLDQFMFGGAYRQFFSEIITSEDAGSGFFMEIMPKRIRAQVAEEVAKSYTDQELLDLSDEEFYKAAGSSDLRNMDKRFTTLAMHRLSNKRNAEPEAPAA